MHNHHGANFLAVAVPTTSFFVQAAPEVTVVTGVLGILWYLYQFWKEYRHWKKRKPPKHEV